MKTLHVQKGKSANSVATRLAARLLLGTSVALLLTSCQSPQGGAGQGSSEGGGSVYRINVLRYNPPVEVPSWKMDAAQAVNSDGAALNVVAAMQHGDVDAWLNCWAPDERPKPDAAERQKLLEKWAAYRDGRVVVLGRVVAALDLIDEISVREQSQKQEVLQLPLKHEDGKWWLTSLSPDNEYMQWQSSKNKLIQQMDPKPFQHYLVEVKAAGNQ